MLFEISFKSEKHLVFYHTVYEKIKWPRDLHWERVPCCLPELAKARQGGRDSYMPKQFKYPGDYKLLCSNKLQKFVQSSHLFKF